MKTNKDIWTIDEDLFLISNFNKYKLTDLANQLQRGKSATYKRCFYLGLKRKNTNDLWTKTEEKFLLDNIYYIPLKRMSKELNKDIYSVINKLIDLNINMLEILHLNLKRNSWLKHELDFLILNYNRMNIDDICCYLNKTKRVVLLKKDELGLKKDKKILKSTFNYYELEILKENYNLSLKNLQLLLPNKSLSQIETKIRKLKLKTKKETIPEKMVRTILDRNNINYISQFKMANCNYVIDFLINDNLAIEVQGDYWHGNPKFYNKLNDVQTKMVNRDKNKYNKIVECNYKLLYIWENELKEDIKNDFKNIELTIISFIQQNK